MYHIVPTLVFVLFLFGPPSDALGNCEVAPGFDANEKFHLFDMAACFLATKDGVVLKVKKKDNKIRFPAYHEIEKESPRCTANRGFRADTNLEILVGEVVHEFRTSFGAEERIIYVFNCQLKHPSESVRFSKLFSPSGEKMVLIHPLSQKDKVGNIYQWRWPDDGKAILKLFNNYKTN
jgi:hypothetical protein